MAFVNRSDRDWPPNKPATSSYVGPGSYGQTTKIPKSRSKVSYAPFSSSSERNGNHEPIAGYTPGPGSYSRTGPLNSAKHDVSTSAFLNNVGRFDRKTNANPGPGSYSTTKNVWRKKGSKARKQQKRTMGQVQWKRVSSAPSIPNVAQSYGYEENKEGDLVLQPHPASGKAGSVGPGSYDAYNQSFGSGQGLTHWSRSKGERLKEEKTTKTPDPGSYEIMGHGVAEGVREGKQQRPTSVFASKTNRIKSKSAQDADAAPGPGQYINPNQGSAFNKASEIKDEYYQFFGSKVGRGGTVKHDSAPGPGDYDTNISQFKRVDVDRELEDVRVGTPFRSSEPRFIASASNSRPHTPGPGAYVGSTNIAYELSKKVFGRNQSFGSTTDRFTGNSTKGAAGGQLSIGGGPGPGAYTEKKLVKPPRPSSSFASSASRFRRKATSDGPAPGAYESKTAFNLNGSVAPPASSVFASTTTRASSANPSRAWVGPGSYNIGDRPKSSAMAARANNTSHQFSSANPRFKGFKNYAVPGPGTYTNDITTTSSLNRRSYNITVGDYD